MRSPAGHSDVWREAASRLGQERQELRRARASRAGDDAQLRTNQLCELIAGGLAAGEPVLVIASETTWSRVLATFERGWLELPGALRAGRVRYLELESTLTRLRFEGRFDAARFEQHVAAIARELRTRHAPAPLRLFSELGDALRSRGDAATTELEGLLDALGAEQASGVQSAPPPWRAPDEPGPPESGIPFERRSEAAVGDELGALRYVTTVVDQMPAAVAIVEARTGKVLFVNRKHDELLGLHAPVTELADYERFALRRPNGAALASHEWPVRRALDAGVEVDAEDLHLRRADGQDTVVRVSASPVRDAQGRVVAAVTIAHDVTEEKRAAAAAEEQHRIGQTMLSVASSINRELDLDALVANLTDHATSLCRAQFGAFFYNVVDDAGESYMLYSLSGAPRSAFAGFPMPRNTDLFRPTFDGTGVVRLDDVTADPRYGKLGPHYGMPAGHLPVRSYLAAPVKARDGRVLGGFFLGHAKPAMFREADEQLLTAIADHAAVGMENATLYKEARRAQALAHRERQKMRELFMQSPALIVVLRGPEHVYDFVNAAAAALIGRDDAVGKTVREVLDGVPDERLTILNHVYRTGERHVNECLRAVRRWGRELEPRERYFNVVYEPYRGSDGAIEGVMSFGFDVTEQVMACRKLETIAHQLEDASRTKDEFLAMVSHELRTPLNAILGWVRLLRLGSLSPEKQAHALETIERNASTQTQLIEDLLDVGRIVSGKLRLDHGAVDLAAVIESAVAAVQPSATSKGVAVEKNVGPAALVPGDAVRLQQVVWNLLANAVKFTPRGGSVKVQAVERGSSVDIVVSDTGQGIAPEFLPRVFERFRQADSTTTRKQGGLGLGLAIVRHLVELHGGSVKVESDGIGHGATFTVSLPLSASKSTPSDSLPAVRLTSAPTAVLEPVLDGVHVLIVDDEPDARDVLAEMLQTCRATVTAAASAADALQLLAERRPHVIVSDIGMPGQDGYELIRQVRQLPKEGGGKVPAIALTAFTRFEDRTRALVSGFTTHTSKPVDATELVTMIVSLVRSEMSS